MAEWRARRGPCPENAPVPHAVSSARISEPRPEFNGGATAGFWRFFRPNRRLREAGSALWHGDAGAIPPAHQHAILGLAEIGDTHSEPDPDRGQRHRERECREVRQHAMTEIVRFVPRALIAGEIVWLPPDIDRRYGPTAVSLAWRPIHGARAELEHPVLVVALGRWPLAFHRCLIRDILWPCCSTSVPSHKSTPHDTDAESGSAGCEAAERFGRIFAGRIVGRSGRRRVRPGSGVFGSVFEHFPAAKDVMHPSFDRAAGQQHDERNRERDYDDPPVAGAADNPRTGRQPGAGCTDRKSVV